MQINVFVLIAQIINFLVLVYLMKRFLFSRVVSAMDRREAQIASRLNEAEAKQKKAADEEASYRGLKQELEGKRQEVLSQAREEAAQLRLGLIDTARKEVDESQAKWREGIDRQKEEFLQDLRRRGGQQILEIARRAVRDLASEELEQHMVETFVKRLRQMKQTEKDAISELSGKTGSGIAIRSAFDIPADQRKIIEETLRKETGGAFPVEFRLAPDLVSGIELSLRDMRISWSLKSYFDALEERLAEAIGHGPERTANPAGGSEEGS